MQSFRIEQAVHLNIVAAAKKNVDECGGRNTYELSLEQINLTVVIHYILVRAMAMLT